MESSKIRELLKLIAYRDILRARQHPFPQIRSLSFSIATVRFDPSTQNFIITHQGRPPYDFPTKELEQAVDSLVVHWLGDLEYVRRLGDQAQYDQALTSIANEASGVDQLASQLAQHISAISPQMRRPHPSSSAQSVSGTAGMWGCGVISALLVLVVVVALLANTVFRSTPSTNAGSATGTMEGLAPTATVDWTSSSTKSDLDAQNGTSFTLPVGGIADALSGKCTSYEGGPFAVNGAWEEVLVVNVTNGALNEQLTQDWFLSVGLCPSNMSVYQAPGAALDNWPTIEAHDKADLDSLCDTGTSLCPVTVLVYQDNGSGNLSQVTQTSFTSP